MGFNTSVVVLNDCLSSIAEDKDLGKRLADAASRIIMRNGPIDVRAGNCMQALQVIETHHADQLVPILVGGNYGYELDTCIHWSTEKEEMELTLLKRLADKHGFHLRKKPTRK